jgi:8-oxo-dGTP diphosphatase
MDSQHSGVFVIIKNRENQVLLGKRLDSYKAGMYGFPGGRLEVNETLADCGRRELFEETGLKARSLKYIGVIREKQNGYNFIHFGFSCSEYTGKITLKEPQKCDGWNFYSPDKLPENILPGHIAGLDMFLSAGLENYKDI